MTKLVRLKPITIEKLGLIAKMQIKQAIENKTFNIDALVKNNRGISFDKEILYLSNFYLESIKHFQKLSPAEKKKSVVGKFLKKVDKMNEIC